MFSFLLSDYGCITFALVMEWVVQVVVKVTHVEDDGAGGYDGGGGD